MALNRVEKFKQVYILALKDEEFRKKVARSKKDFKGIEKSGTSAFKKIGIGIAAAGGIIFAFVRTFQKIKGTINLASDLEEGVSKLHVVFSDFEKQVDSVVDSLVTGFGFSRVEATKLVAASGDLLTGFGATQKEALELSTTVSKLAADVASFSNAKTEDVAQAFNKALIGETESAKTYGVAISQLTVMQKLAEKSQDKLTGSALRVAKAFATVEILTEQSKNAIGDFARTSNSFANQSKILTAQLEDISTIMGQKLLKSSTGMVRTFVDLTREIKEFVAVPLSEKLEEERLEVNGLVGAIVSASTATKERTELIKTLKREYPEFLKSLDVEKTTNEDLVKALKDYNTETIKRIQLMAISEEKENAIAEAIRKTIKARTAQRELNKLYAEALGKDADLTLSAEEKVQQMFERGVGERIKASGLQQQLTVFTMEATEAQKEAVELLKELNDLQKEYNITLEEAGDSAEALAEPLDVLKQIREEIAKVKEAQSLLGSNPEWDAWVAQIEEDGKLLEDLMSGIGAGLVQGFDVDGLKGALKNVLLLVLDFLKSMVLAAQVGAGTKAVFGDFSGLLQIAGIQALFELAKVAISSFRGGVENFQPGGSGAVVQLHKDEKRFLPTGSRVQTSISVKRDERRNATAMSAPIVKKIDELIDVIRRQKLGVTGRTLSLLIEKDKQNLL